MGMNTSSAKSFEDMANEQENAEVTAVETKTCNCEDSCDCTTEVAPCKDESCDCNKTPKE